MGISQKINRIKIGYLTLMSLLFITFIIILSSTNQVQENYRIMQEEHMEVIMTGSSLKSLLSEQQVQLVRYMDEKDPASYYFIVKLQQEIHKMLTDLGDLQRKSDDTTDYKRLVRTLKATDAPLETLLSRSITDESERYTSFVAYVSSINLATTFTDRIILHQYELYTERRIKNENSINFSREVTVLGGLSVFFGAFYFYRFLRAKVNVMEDEGKKDSLTGLYNKRYLEKLMHSYQEKSEDHTMHMVILDLDHFKIINDKYGHVVGDTVIKIFSDLILNSLRKEDYAFRFGGEEFLVLLLGMKDNDVHRVCERIRKTLESTPIHIKNFTITLTVTIGFAKGSTKGDYLMVLEQADHFLYVGKRNGRNQTVWKDTVS
ncbi:GGDEF domain-containing protein [Tindallia californiensis]|uniref:Diguanylate cyclase (GGDEF) domain-containing protein n=1 Tax=Tindallia californiensis TaxID=159292 RepID=A0A1H3KDH1_9FIRM|nr:GGDEF domain-containing protein [Tindallia californiensis]SDY50217.1 diguanylate cyclase (GGDEF) domain-containing protein [Tindallia californiensis]